MRRIKTDGTVVPIPAWMEITAQAVAVGGRDTQTDEVSAQFPPQVVQYKMLLAETIWVGVRQKPALLWINRTEAGLYERFDFDFSKPDLRILYLDGNLSSRERNKLSRILRIGLF